MHITTEQSDITISNLETPIIELNRDNYNYDELVINNIPENKNESSFDMISRNTNVKNITPIKHYNFENKVEEFIGRSYDKHNGGMGE